MQHLRRKTTITLSVAITILALATAALYAPVSAEQPLPPHVGDQFTIESLRGEARIFDPTTNTTRTENATLQLSAVVGAVGERGLKFNITGGEITLGEESYTMTRGVGYTIKRGGFIMFRGEGLNENGESIRFAYRGLIFPRQDAIQAMLFGGLSDGDLKIGFRFRVIISKVV